MSWTREHDKAIAEKCEGVAGIYEWNDGAGIDLFYRAFRDPGAVVPDVCRVPRYFTDLAACVRAAEAWKRQESMENTRSWSIQSGGTPKGVPIAILVDVVIPANSWAESRAEPCAALAWALHHAVSPAPAQGGPA